MDGCWWAVVGWSVEDSGGWGGGVGFAPGCESVDGGGFFGLADDGSGGVGLTGGGPLGAVAVEEVDFADVEGPAVVLELVGDALGCWEEVS